MKIFMRAHSILIVTLFVAAAALCQTAPFQQPYCGSKLQRQRLFLGNAPDPQDVGKSLVIGRLKTIEHTKLTISRMDGVEQLVIVDAGTEFFSYYGCAATLADFKTGEQIYAIGINENGDFVATKVLKAPSDSNAPALSTCNCSSPIRAEGASPSNLGVNGVGTQCYLWHMWTKAYDVGHELPVK